MTHRLFTIPFCGRIEFEYVNHKGEIETRRIAVHSFAYGTTKYHPQPQPFVRALCLDRNADRVFALLYMRDIRHLDDGRTSPMKPQDSE